MLYLLPLDSCTVLRVLNSRFGEYVGILHVEEVYFLHFDMLSSIYLGIGYTN